MLAEICSDGLIQFFTWIVLVSRHPGLDSIRLEPVMAAANPQEVNEHPHCLGSDGANTSCQMSGPRGVDPLQQPADFGDGVKAESTAGKQMAFATRENEKQRTGDENGRIGSNDHAP